MRVRTKLIISISMMVVLFWFICHNAGVNFGNLQKRFAAVENDIIPDTSAVAEVERAADDVYHESMDYILYNMTGAKEAALSKMNYLKDISEQYIPYGENVGNELNNTNQKLMSKIEVLNTSIIALMNLKEYGASHDQLMRHNSGTSLPALLDLKQFATEREMANIENLALVKADFDQAYNNSIRSLLIYASLITLIAVGASILITRSITRPLHALHKGTEIIGEGNLDYKVSRLNVDFESIRGLGLLVVPKSP